MRKLMLLAPVVALALVSANCSGSAFNSPTGPGVDVSDSATEAKGGGGGGKKPGGGGGGTTGGGGGTTGGGGGSLAIVMLNDGNGDGLPNVGDTITFNLTTSAAQPFVRVECYQGSAWVYVASVGYFEQYPWEKRFILSSGSWLSGAAACKATLYTSVDGSSTTTLATLNFTAGA